MMVTSTIRNTRALFKVPYRERNVFIDSCFLSFVDWKIVEAVLSSRSRNSTMLSPYEIDCENLIRNSLKGATFTSFREFEIAAEILNPYPVTSREILLKYLL